MLSRRAELYSYDIFPKVVPVGCEVTINVRVLDPHLMGDFPYTVSLYAINDAGKVLVYNFLVPVFGTVLSGIFLHEVFFTVKNLIALVLVCAGIIIVNMTTEKNKPAPL